MQYYISISHWGVFPLSQDQAVVLLLQQLKEKTDNKIIYLK